MYEYYYALNNYMSLLTALMKIEAHPDTLFDFRISQYSPRPNPCINDRTLLPMIPATAIRNSPIPLPTPYTLHPQRYCKKSS